MKYAVIFPGQGSQSLGMLADLADNFAIVKDTFAHASDVLGFDLWQLTQTDANALNQTQNTQPAMLAAGYATYQVLNAQTDLPIACMAGHSLGEYSALVAADALDFADAIRLVRTRAELMQSAVPVGMGAMAAILGLDDETVIKICSDYGGDGVVEAVNFNAPGQVVIAGNAAAVKMTCAAMKASGAKRAVLLPVSVPSHSSLMLAASAAFQTTIDNTQFKLGNIEVLHNVDGLKADNIDAIKHKLVTQLCQPVLWTNTVKSMASMGIETLIESGPGKVLSSLNRRIDKGLKAMAIFDTKSLQGLIK